MKVVRDDAIERRWIFVLGRLQPLSFQFGEKYLELRVRNDLVIFLLLLRRSEPAENAQQYHERRYLGDFHKRLNEASSSRQSDVPNARLPRFQSAPRPPSLIGAAVRDER